MENLLYRAPLHINVENDQLIIRLVSGPDPPIEVSWSVNFLMALEVQRDKYANTRSTKSRDATAAAARILSDSIKNILFGKNETKNSDNEIWRFLANKINKSEAQHVILEINTHSPKIANIPWEFACFPASDNKTADIRRERFSVVRMAVDSIPEARQPRTPGVHENRLICYADPQNSTINNQIIAQAQGIKAIRVPWLKDNFRPDLNWDSLKTQLEDELPYIFQFIGHGEADRNIAAVFLNTNASQNFTDLQPAQRFIATFQGRAPRLAVLMACQSAWRPDECPSVAEAFVHAGAHTAIGNLIKINEPAARCFTEHFYKKIQNSIDENIPLWTVIEAARDAVYHEAGRDTTFHPAEAYTPVVYIDGTMESLHLPLRPSARSLNEVILSLCAHMDREDFFNWKNGLYMIMEEYRTANNIEYTYDNLFGTRGSVFSKISFLTKLLTEAFGLKGRYELEILRLALRNLISRRKSMGN